MKSFKEFSSEVKAKAKSRVDKLHDQLHHALMSSGHTPQPIPKSDGFGKLPSGNPEKAFTGGVHGWVHPDGTYYHIDQKEGLNSYHFSDGAIHHSMVKEKMQKFLPKGSKAHHHLAQISGTIQHPRNMIVYSKKLLTPAQQATLHAGIIQGGYGGIEHEVNPEPEERGKFRGAAEHAYDDESHFPAKVRRALRAGRPIV